MNKKAIRNSLRLLGAILFSPLYLPHLAVYGAGVGRYNINSDLRRIKRQINISIPNELALLYLLHNNAFFRTLFYFRIGATPSLLIGWYRPGDKYFAISRATKIGAGVLLAHPFSTLINAKSIGCNFSCMHCTTIGAKGDGRPTIGDNVALGCNVSIIGDVHVGDNVTIGAGSVVVKDIPDNCIAAGNPARVIRSNAK